MVIVKSAKLSLLKGIFYHFQDNVNTRYVHPQTYRNTIERGRNPLIAEEETVKVIPTCSNHYKLLHPDALNPKPASSQKFIIGTPMMGWSFPLLISISNIFHAILTPRRSKSNIR